MTKFEPTDDKGHVCPTSTRHLRPEQTRQARRSPRWPVGWSSFGVHPLSRRIRKQAAHHAQKQLQLQRYRQRAAHSGSCRGKQVQLKEGKQIREHVQQLSPDNACRRCISNIKTCSKTLVYRIDSRQCQNIERKLAMNTPKLSEQDQLRYANLHA